MEKYLELLIAYSFMLYLLFRKHKLTQDSNWLDIGVEVVFKLGAVLFCVWAYDKAVIALVYVVSNTWCAIVFPFTGVCK